MSKQQPFNKLRNRLSTLLVAALLATMTGCAVNQDGRLGPDGQVFNKSTVIPLGGGILGAVICNKLFKGHGSRDGWTAACGAAGYFASTAFINQYNKSMETSRIGQTSSWSDPDGKNYTVTPTKTYYQGDNPCREFRQTVEIDGQIEVLEGKACRQENGTWKLVS